MALTQTQRQRAASLRILRNMRASGNRLRNTSAGTVANSIKWSRTSGLSFEDNRDWSAAYQRDSENQATHGDRTAYATMARVYNQNQRTNNHDYTQPGNYSHDARYRNIRRAFGMSAG